ncbi:hypothetical protein [Laspinema olomoucense]|uniref:Uncharacterized protein n=1 Tax=Laspinema olomoucense D3b TaxID=2953688 RepID=A0ABT2N4K5_9CYAN|nr:hypothetical protein [Laspinema sp. D3b]MCT7977605.1 hypothetical protein [Laspinema sp. D3b]
MRKYWLSIVLPCVLGMWVAISSHAIVVLKEFLTLFHYFFILFASLTGPLVTFAVLPIPEGFLFASFLAIILLPITGAYIIKPGFRTAIVSRVGICIWITTGYFWLALMTYGGFGDCIYKGSCLVPLLSIANPAPEESHPLQLSDNLYLLEFVRVPKA